MSTTIKQQLTQKVNHLADIASFLLSGSLEKLLPDQTTDEVSDTYTIYGDEEEEINRRELALRLDRNIENVIHHYGPSDFLDNFLLHLQAECLDIKHGKWDEVVSSNPYILVEAIRILSQRKTFKGTCPVCKDW